jgi:hypothetical protein
MITYNLVDIWAKYLPNTGLRSVVLFVWIIVASKLLELILIIPFNWD